LKHYRAGSGVNVHLLSLLVKEKKSAKHITSMSLMKDEATISNSYMLT